MLTMMMPRALTGVGVLRSRYSYTNRLTMMKMKIMIMMSVVIMMKMKMKIMMIMMMMILCARVTSRLSLRQCCFDGQDFHRCLIIIIITISIIITQSVIQS